MPGSDPDAPKCTMSLAGSPYSSQVAISKSCRKLNCHLFRFKRMWELNIYMDF